MSRLRNARRSSLLAAPILAALSGGVLSAAFTSTSFAASGVSSKGEWFREEPPRAPADAVGPTEPVAAAPTASDLGTTPTAPAAPATPAVPADGAVPAVPAVPAAPPVSATPPAPPSFGDSPRQRSYTGGFGGYGGSGGYGYPDYPSAQVYNYVVAHTRAVTARAMFRRAETELAIAYREARRTFENSQAYLDAVRDERVAYDELNNTRRKSLRSLADDIRYQHLGQLRQDLTDEIARRRAAHNISQEEIYAMAKLKMSYAVDMRAMEAEVIAGDGGQVRAAQDRLVNAGSRLAALRAHYDEALRTSPEIVAARRNLEDARLASYVAEAYLSGAGYASDQALDYAYYLHRSRPYSFSDSGYGYGYGYGYGLRY